MTDDVLTAAIDALASRRDLEREQTAAVLAEIMRGNATEVQIAAFLIALRTKGETQDELAGLAQAMRAFATPVKPRREHLLDTAGTGGGRRTFNISTTAALIAAGAGCAVAKHGNRSATGLSGSADVLEALGARLDLSPEGEARAIDETGFGFMFAPGPPRRDALRRPGAPRPRRADRLQPARPADQSGRRAAPARRRRRPREPRARRGRAHAAWTPSTRW